MKIKSYKLMDERFGNQWFDEIKGHWDYDDFISDDKWRKGWISMDCALYNEEEDRIYLGITSFDADITKAFDRKTGTFIDLGYKKIADPYDSKFHRALVKRKSDGSIYAAIALLHCSDRQWDAPGGAIVRYDPKTNNIEKLCIPIPHVYIQAMVLDEERDLLFCQCFPPEYLITYSLRTGEVKNLGLVGSGIEGMAQGENIEFDNDGNLWGPWCLTRAWAGSKDEDMNRIFCVPAGSDKIEFLKTGLPKRDGSYGYEKMEGIFNLGDGYMYASGGNGSLYRIDTSNGKATYLFTPISDRPSRLASMVVAPDGYAYGVVGRNGNCRLLRFDFKNTKYELLGKIIDENGEACYQVHHIISTNDGTLYACENDNHYRSSYLWEIKL